MKITITQADIDRAKGHSLAMNPLVWAVARQTGLSIAYCDGLVYPTVGEPVLVPEELRVWLWIGATEGVWKPREVDLDLPVEEAGSRSHYNPDPADPGPKKEKK